MSAGSNAMRDRLMVLDRDPRVVGLAGRPVRLWWRDAVDGRARSWVAQLFVRYADGSALPTDCPGRTDAGGERALQAAAVMAEACTRVGWVYRRLEPPDPVSAANLRWPAGYRHPRSQGRPGLMASVGAQVCFRGGWCQVVGLAGTRIHLAGEDGEDEVVLAGCLFADPGFAVSGGGQPRTLPQWGLFETAPAAAQERALAWQRHIREVECGRAGGPDGGGVVRQEYDPARFTPAEREWAKARELTALGFGRVSWTTVQRMRGRYRRQGLWGLVDHRTTRAAGGVGRTDERVVAAIEDVLRGRRGRSKGTVKALMPSVARVLEDRHGDAVAIPSQATFYRLVRELARPADHPGHPVRNPRSPGTGVG
ncbi:TnsA-like heteromeric transposase endonuclease subunit [Embleya sp. NPDC050493]|uniref:TnsA-like heteromeric transposase endonuclease subunit n=1 Tax=Embleya sp. NPDC050493 TaxID=3363989 RepID=UPI00379B1373